MGVVQGRPEGSKGAVCLKLRGGAGGQGGGEVRVDRGTHRRGSCQPLEDLGIFLSDGWAATGRYCKKQ